MTWVEDVDSVIPPEPPEAVLAEVDAAMRRAARLIATGRELHFSHDDAGRVVVEAFDARRGATVRLSPSDALEF